ncbi:IS3 family transposase [Candidatus Mycoplasma pogonae]
MPKIDIFLDSRNWIFSSYIKSESLNFIDISKITFQELKQEIQTYIDWYNNERI